MLTVRNLWLVAEIIALLAVYGLYALVFIKIRSRASTERVAAPKTIRIGIILQSLAYSVAWAFRRRTLVLFGTVNPPAAIGMMVLSLAPALAGVWLTARAKKALGPQWGLAARTVEGHKLIVSGPYAYCRHPIYLGMAGLLLGTIVGLSSIAGAAGAVILFGAGTVIRIRTEDSLLRDAFGSDFEAYRRRVPAFLPLPGRKP